MRFRPSCPLFGVLLFVSLQILASSSVSAQTGGVSVRIISAPPDGEGPDQLGPIRIRVQDPQGVCGEKFVNCRVALFSHTDAFYPQPTLDHQLVDIDSTGLVEERIHLGHKYTALVVRADRYQMQPEKVWSLPIRFALAKDEVLPGAEVPDVEPASTMLTPTAVHANLPVPVASPIDSNPGHGLTIRILSAPPSGEGGPNKMATLKASVKDPEGVCGKEFIKCRVALFTFADGQWYPQPFLNRQVVEIGSDGLVSEKVHLGSEYAALVVSAEQYPSQPEQLSTLPLTHAQAETKARAGEQTTEPSSDWLRWVGGLIFGPVVLVIILVLLLSLFLGLSGKLNEFCEALAFSLPKLIEVPASRLRELMFTIRRTEGEKALKFIAAAICFPLAIGLAVANYYVVRFSLELFLTDFSSALTILAAAFVVLKGAAGMLLHVLGSSQTHQSSHQGEQSADGKRPHALKGFFVKFVIVLALLATSICGAFLAYRRAEAMQEDKKSAPVSTPAPESGVMINEPVLGNLTATNAPAPQSDSSPAESWVVKLFSREALFVAALAVILDFFEIICVYGAFHLSASAIIWLLTLPLTIANEVVGFAKETQLMNVVAIFATATLTALNTLITSAAKGIRDLSLAAVDGGKKIVASIRESWRKLRHKIKYWKIHNIRRKKRLELLDIQRAGKVAEAQALQAQAEDLRQSVRIMKQKEYEFNQQELSETNEHRKYIKQEEHKFDQQEWSEALEHRKDMNKKLRDTATSALEENLDKMGDLTTLIGEKLTAEAGKRADQYCEAKGAPLAEETAETVAFQAGVVNKMGTSVNGFYPPKTPPDKTNLPTPSSSANSRISQNEGGLQ